MSNYFRPQPKRSVNGLLIVAALVAFDLWIVGMVVLDIGRFHGWWR